MSTHTSNKFDATTVPMPGGAVLKTGFGRSGISSLYKSPVLLASISRCKLGLVTCTLIFLMASLHSQKGNV